MDQNAVDCANLLIVDDDPNIIKALYRMLHRERYQLLTTSCPEEAVSLVEDQSVDVVLADHHMPDMLGTELR